MATATRSDGMKVVEQVAGRLPRLDERLGLGEGQVEEEQEMAPGRDRLCRLLLLPGRGSDVPRSRTSKPVRGSFLRLR